MAPTRRSLARFLLASLALHLAALPLAARLAPAPPPAAPVREVELVPPPRHRAPPAPSPAGRPAPVPGSPARLAARGTRAHRAARPRAPAPAADLAPLLSMRGAAERAEQGPPRRVDLTPSPRMILGERGLAHRERGHERGRRSPGGRDDALRTKQNLDELLAQVRDRQELESGRVHPFLYRVERSAEGSFRPDWTLVASDVLGRGTLKQSYRGFVAGIGKQYLEELRRYRDAHRGLPEEADRGRMLEGYNRLLAVAEKNAGTMACELCVRFEARAEPPAIRFRHRSGNRAFDRLALESLRRTARLEALPPDAPATEACYEFSARFHRVPPLPIVGCSFDESKPSISCFYPTKKIMSKRVKLVSIRRRAPGKG